MWVAAAQALGSFCFPGSLAGAGSEMEQSGVESATIWDAEAVSDDLDHCIIAMVPGSLSFGPKFCIPSC